MIIQPGGNNANLLRIGTGGITVEDPGASLIIETNFRLRNDQVWRVQSAAGELILRDGAGANKSIDLNSRNLTVNGPGNTTIRSDISGVGNVDKRGMGTLLLTGNNSFSGGWTVHEGEISISADSNLGAAGLTLNGGDLRITAPITVSNGISFEPGGTNKIRTETNNVTLTGNLGGGGQWEKLGSGTLTLTGNNGNSSILYVRQGTVQGIPSKFNNIVSVDQGASTLFTDGGTYAGSISGLGGIGKVGGNVLSLTGSNSPALITIAGGGVSLNTNTSGDVNIGSSQELYINQSYNGTYSGNIHGSGRLFKQGSGTVTLAGGGTGANNYSGGTIIEGGRLQGTTSSLQGGIQLANPSTSVSFNQSFSGTYAGGISGPGTLWKYGSGILTLTGSNTHTGQTWLRDGAIVANTNSVRGDASLNTGTTFTFNQTSNGTYGGQLSGPGTFRKLGSSTIELAGDNQHTGGTDIIQGALRTTTQNLSGPITISQGANLIYDQADYGIVSSPISGAGGVVKEGSGTVVLNSPSTFTYSGPTTINGGDLTVWPEGFVSNVSIASGASLTLATSLDPTYGGQIAGDGKLRKTGGGRLTLTGANSYTGGTDVFHGGSLQGTTSSIQGPVSLFDNSALEIQQGFAGTLTSSVSGTGSLVKSGSGRILLGGANTFVGSLDILEGIAAGDTTSIQQPVSVAAGAAVEFAFNSGTRTLSTDVSGAGKLVKSGGGTLSIPTSPGYTGGTNVAGGTLDLTGALAGPVSILNGGRLTGSGEVSSAVHIHSQGEVQGSINLGGSLQNSGRYAPNASVTIGGGYIQDGNGTLGVKLGSGTLIEVSGEAHIRGTIEIDATAVEPLEGLEEYAEFAMLTADAIDFDFTRYEFTAPPEVHFWARSGLLNGVPTLFAKPVAFDALDAFGDVNYDETLDEIDIRGMAAALYSDMPVLEFNDGTGRVAFGFRSVFDRIDDGDQVVDFDDLAYFAERLSEQTGGSIAASYAMIDKAVAELGHQVPEPPTWPMVVAVLVMSYSFKWSSRLRGRS